MIVHIPVPKIDISGKFFEIDLEIVLYFDGDRRFVMNIKKVNYENTTFLNYPPPSHSKDECGDDQATIMPKNKRINNNP